jgi:O-antigen/teichoic acid export membrane protein
MTKPQPDFWKNVITALAGATAAQALPLLAAPLLTRMCTPAEMGTFSVWLGVVAVASIMATLRFDAAIVLDHEKQQQRLCLGVVAYSASMLALALTVLMATARIMGLPAVGDMTWFELLTIGIGTWLTAYIQTALAYAASHNLFGKAAKAKILQAGAIALSQLALLYAGLSSAGLLAGQIIGLGTGLLATRLLLSPPTTPFKLVLDDEQRAYLVKRQAFWRYSLPSSLLNVLVGQLPLFMIGLKHGAMAAGFFALTQRVVAAPTSLIAASVLDVFKRQAAHEFRYSGHCSNVYQATFKTLVLLAMGPSLLLLFFSPQLFSWLFGPEWRPAGELARILAPLGFFNFIASPLSYVFFIAGKQKIELRWQVALFVMTVIVFGAPLSLRESVLGYMVGRSALYLVYLYMSYQCSRRSRPSPELADRLQSGRVPAGGRKINSDNA